MKLFKRWRRSAASAEPVSEPAPEPKPAVEQVEGAKKIRRRPATMGRTASELDYLVDVAQRAQGDQSSS